MSVRYPVRRPLLMAVVALLFCACASGPQWAPYGDVTALTLERWMSDLDTLESEIQRHPRLRVAPAAAAAFGVSLQGLRESLTDAARAGRPLAAPAIAGIAQALATVGDAHTCLNTYPTEVFGCDLRWFPLRNGTWELRLVMADRSHGAWLGGKLMAVRSPQGIDVPVGDGGRPEPGTVNGSLASVVSREYALDEELDALACRSAGPAVLHDPMLVRGLGLAADALTLVFDPATLPADTPAVLALLPRRTGEWVHLLDAAPTTALSRRSHDPWWYDLDETGMLYLQYNECDTEAVRLLDEVASAVEAGEARALIVDFRSNSGGPSGPGSRLASRIAGTALGQEPARLFVLVGPVTFSSAMMNGADFKASTRAIFAGLPLVEPTSHYGEVIRFTLPESGLVIGRSSRFYRDYGGLGTTLPRGVIEPDAGWTLEPTFEEYAAGRDPVLEAVLAAATR